MIAKYLKFMDGDEKGTRFLELIDEQSNIQWSIVAKLSALISSDWNSMKLQDEIKTLVENHSKITKELNSLDDSSSIL
jgi:hypothetical protein